MRIAVVDDSEEVSRIICASMERRGFTVVPFSGGADFLRTFAAGEKFDGVLLDMMMPHPGGRDVLLKIRETDEDLPVIVLTAMGAQSRAEALVAGANATLQKPPDFDQIAKMFQSLK